MLPILRLNYPLDEARLRADAEEARPHAKGFNEPRHPGEQRTQQDYFRISRWESPYIISLMDDLGVKGSPRFYFQDPFSDLDMHVDIGTKCAVNIILSDDPAPITYESGDHHYRQALINTSIPHTVRNGPVERVLFKISILEHTFEEVSRYIRYRAEQA